MCLNKQQAANVSDEKKQNCEKMIFTRLENIWNF
jgi:hypothetical protein